jgi:hypothetical protein
VLPSDIKPKNHYLFSLLGHTIVTVVIQLEKKIIRRKVSSMLVATNEGAPIPIKLTIKSAVSYCHNTTNI